MDSTCRLRPLAAGDLEFLRELRNRPEIRRQFFSQQEITPEQQQRWYANYCQGQTDRMFVIEDEAGRAAGGVSLYHVDLTHGQAEFGRLMVHPECRGRGLARLAITEILRHGFGELGLHRIHLQVFADNEPARRLYERCGFRLEGRLREAFLQPGEGYRDILNMAILASEWSGS